MALGKIAFDAYCNVSKIKGLRFGHNKIYPIYDGKTLIVSYHPSRRNTNTGYINMAYVDKYLSNGQIDNKWREQNRREHVILINSDKSKTVDSSFVYLLRHQL